MIMCYSECLIVCFIFYMNDSVWLIQGDLNESVTLILNDWFCVIDSVGLIQIVMIKCYSECLIGCFIFYMNDSVWLIQGDLNESVTLILNDWFCVIDSVGLIQIVMIKCYSECLIGCFIFYMNDSVGLIPYDWFSVIDSIGLILLDWFDSKYLILCDSFKCSRSVGLISLILWDRILVISLFRGGLAERLNRLHSRQKSAISFWRHQCNSTTSAGKTHPIWILFIWRLNHVLNVSSVQIISGYFSVSDH